MLTPNNAKDLMALACVAFQSKDFEGAGSLFAQAMSLHDSENFIDTLLVDNFSCAALAFTVDDAVNTDDEDDLSSIASTLSFNMSTAFRQNLKQSLSCDTDFDELSQSSECAKKASLSDDFEDESDDDEDYDLSSDDLESDSAESFPEVQSSIRLV